MQAIAVVISSFILLCTYLEISPVRTLASYGVTPPPAVIHRDQAAATVAAAAEVERTETSLASRISEKAVSSSKQLLRDLNLSVPFQIVGGQLPSTKRTRLVLEPVEQAPKISYSAELLFDEKEGSSIRGGKVDIKIPLG